MGMPLLHRKGAQQGMKATAYCVVTMIRYRTQGTGIATTESFDSKHVLVAFSASTAEAAAKSLAVADFKARTESRVPIVSVWCNAVGMFAIDGICEETIANSQRQPGEEAPR